MNSTMSSDPWVDLPPPRGEHLAGARRVDTDIPWDFYWARGTDGHHLLLLHHQSSLPQAALPAAKGLRVRSFQADQAIDRTLVIELLDSGLKDVFHELCLDIVGRARACNSEQEAVAATIDRTWRWHRLLRGAGNDRLSLQEQIGLLGELYVLERLLLPLLAPDEAVSCWKGPIGAPQDFLLRTLAIEAKAVSAGDEWVRISSAEQLDPAAGRELVLYVLSVEGAAEDGAGECLADVVARMEARLHAGSPDSAGGFRKLLLAAGYDRALDYSEPRWVVSAPRMYRVDPRFPAIRASMLPSTVSKVRYSINLPACAMYLMQNEDVVTKVEEQTHDA